MRRIILMLVVLFAMFSMTAIGQSDDWLNPGGVSHTYHGYVIPTYHPTPVDLWWNGWNAPSAYYSGYTYRYNSYDPWWRSNVYHSGAFSPTYYYYGYPSTAWSTSWSGTYWRTSGSYVLGRGIFLV